MLGTDLRSSTGGTPIIARRNKHDVARRYGLAILAAIVALLLRELLTPFLGENNPYHTVWAAVVFSAWYCGLGPSILTALLSVVGIWYWFLPPVRSFALEDPRRDIFGMIGFLFFSGLIIALGETNRRSLSRRQSVEDQLQQAHDELERKVQERTIELNVANDSLRELSGRLQQLRDDERRHIARELHDSVGQLLAALGMNFDAILMQSRNLDPATVRALGDSRLMVEQISSEIRTISHLLHPPLLDAAGLASALRWYVDGFSERSKIKVDLHIPEEIGRLSDELEIAIFRMVQECLTNIHRHSGSASATIRLLRENQRIRVEVQDSGKGISPEQNLALRTSGQTGVGFRGMRERLRQLGGTLQIKSDETGTAVIVSLPVQESALEDADTQMMA
ncbi:MAG: sensor histidine kinase [Candidatus Sulfotelmatobacter sp.]